VSERKAFLLRVDPELLDALQKWAEDELRSLNGQIEYVLRESLKREGRGRSAKGSQAKGPRDEKR
jgi:hypothetical protein